MKALLKTLTPVHIGSGVTYNKGIDFIQDQMKIGIIDENKILSLIGKEYVGQWVAAIEKYDPQSPGKTQPILDLLESRSIRDFSPEMVSSRICTLRSLNNRSNFLKEQYRTSLKGPCIPGSSLKGSLKTALLDDITGYEDFLFNIEDIRSLKKGETIWEDDKIDKQIFGDNANEKSTRFLKIGDIQYDNLKTEVHEVRVLNLTGESWEFKVGQNFLAETIPANKTASFNLTLDLGLLKLNKDKYPNLWPERRIFFLENLYTGFCHIINEFTRELLKWELDVLEEGSFPEEGEKMLEIYSQLLNELNGIKDNEFIIRLGGNSGWIFTTGGWWRKFVDDIEDEDLNAIRIAIQKNDYSSMDVWPKTRKISSEGNIFGFVKVSFTPK